MPDNHTTFKDYLHLHFIVFIWGFTAIIGKLVSIPAISLVYWRTLFSAIGLLLLLLILKKRIIIDRSLMLKYLLVGAVIGLHWIGFFASARLSNVSVCLAGMSTCSFWTSLIEPLFQKRKISIFDILMSLIIIAGLYMIFLFEFDKAAGLLVAVFAAFLAGIFGTMNKSLAGSADPLTMGFYELAGSNLVALVAILLTKIFSPNQLQIFPGIYDTAWILVLAFACTIYPHVTSLKLLKKFSAFVMSLTINLEPVYGILLAYLIFGESEHMSGGFYLGALIILLTVLSYPLVKNRLLSK